MPATRAPCSAKPTVRYARQRNERANQRAPCDIADVVLAARRCLFCPPIVVGHRQGWPTAVALSTDHSPARLDERQRIESMGGTIENHCGVLRVDHQLTVTR